MNKVPAPELPDRTKERLLLLVFFLLLLYVILPRVSSFSDSLDVLDDARLGLAVVAFGLLLLTNFFSAGMYMILAARPLRLGRTVLVQFANAFANRLLPAGLGGLALNVRYLQKSGHRLPEAVAVAGANNTLGFVGHMLLLLGIVSFGGSQALRQLHAPHLPSWTVFVAVAIAVLALNIFISRRLSQRINDVAGQAVRQLLAYGRQPWRLLLALLCSLMLTSCYVAVLFFSVWSVAHHMPSLPDMFVVFTVGIAAATATPTPGGLGGAEAGLMAALVAYGYDAAPALAAVLLYRLVTYWLPLVPGFVAFAIARKRYL